MTLMNRKRWGVVGGAVVLMLIVLTVLAFRDPEEGGSVNFHAGSFEANNNTSTASSYSSSDNDIFLARRIAVVSESNHPVIKRVTRNLAAALEGLAFVEEVGVLTDERPEPGELLYDFYVLIEMPKFESRGLLAMGRKVSAEIKCSMGSGLWNSNHRTNDHLTPALVDPSVEITLNHESTERGVETPNIRFQQVGEDVSKQLVEQVTKPLTGFASKFGTLRELPAGLYPCYRPLPEFPAPWNERLVEIFNGRGFMLHNQSVFTMKTTTPYDDLKTTREILKERGWRLDSKNFKQNNEGGKYYYRGTFDNVVSEAFEVRDYGPRATNEEVRLVFRYSDRMNKGEVAAVFAEAYGDDIPMDLWQCFSRMLPGEVNERMLEKLVGTVGLSAALEERVIRHLEKTGRGEQARARLRPAYFAAMIIDADKAKQILKLGREIMDDKKWKPGDFTEADLEAMNIPRAEPGAPFEIEVALGESARYHVGPADELEILAFTVKRSEIPEGRYTLVGGNFSVAGGSRGSMSTTPHGINTPWRCHLSSQAGGIRWSVTAEEIGDARFQLMIEGRE